MQQVVIYHNPRCSKSRQTVALCQQRGIVPTVIHYLDQPPSKTVLAALLKKLALSPRDLLRRTEKQYTMLKLDDETLSDAQLLQAMVDHPSLMQRPIVVVGERAVLGRPPERVLEII